MSDSTIVEKISRALARKHYEDRFGQAKGREEIVQQNVDANWMIFSADAELAMKTAGEEFAKIADQGAWEHRRVAQRWDDAPVEGSYTRSSMDALAAHNRLQADGAGEIAAAIRRIVNKEK